MDARDLSQLPSVSKLLESDVLRRLPHHSAATAARQALDEARRAANGVPGHDALLARAEELALLNAGGSYRPAINCTGTILNTGLGRAKLADAAVVAAARAAGHVSLEIDLDSGRRGDRQTPLSKVLCQLTGAQAGFVVNNNAAAVMLSVNTFAVGKEVLLSRGQSIEIGGSFRMPDVVRSAGATLVDVGTTNKTRIADYEKAITPNTGAILRCHPSNFVMSGFVEEPAPAELAKFAREKRIPLIDDVGSGCLVNTEDFGLPHEPTLRESAASGANVVTASGDKLLGGPQAGVLLGDKETIANIKSNPLARAVRIDKLAAAALEATLSLYLQGELSEIPTLRYLARTEGEVGAIAEKVAANLANAGVRTRVEKSKAEPGGGSLPGATLPSYRVGVESPGAVQLARKLRSATTPIIGYIEDDVLWLDMRCVEMDEIDVIVTTVIP